MRFTQKYKVFKGRSCNPKEEYKRLADRYPEVATTCDYFQFAVQGQRKTPVANAKTLVQIILLLPGEQAARMRTEASRVFVAFLVGSRALVEKVLKNRRMQEQLKRENPEHWARYCQPARTSDSPRSPRCSATTRLCPTVFFLLFIFFEGFRVLRYHLTPP